MLNTLIKSTKCKIVLLGSGDSFKERIVSEFIYGGERYVGPNSDRIVAKKIIVKDQEYELDIHDTFCGAIFSEQYDLRDVDALCFVYSVGHRDSFQNVVDNFMKALDNNCKPSLPLFLIGTDFILTIPRQVESKRGQKLAKLMGAHFIELDPKEIHLVYNLFHEIVLKVFWPGLSLSDEKKDKKSLKDKCHII